MVKPTAASEFDRRIQAHPDEGVWREHYAPETPARIHRQAVLRRALAPRPGKWILDVGCGAGGLSFWAAQQGARAVGVDFSGASLAAGTRIARRLGEVRPRYVQADATRLPVRSGTFHTAICVDVLDVLPPSLHADLMRELLRVVRPGGRVVLYTPNARREWIGRAIRPLRRLFGAWRAGASVLLIGLTGPSRLRRLVQSLGVQGTLTFCDMNYPWLCRLPLLRAWLAGHMLWAGTRPDRDVE